MKPDIVERLRSRLAEAEALLLKCRDEITVLDNYLEQLMPRTDCLGGPHPAVYDIDAFLAREQPRCSAALSNAGQCYKPEGHDGQHSLFDASVKP